MNHVGSSPQLETLNTNNINLHVGNLILKMSGVLPKPTKYAKGAQIFCLSPLHKRQPIWAMSPTKIEIPNYQIL